MLLNHSQNDYSIRSSEVVHSLKYSYKSIFGINMAFK